MTQVASLPSRIVNARAKHIIDEDDDWPTATQAKLGAALLVQLLNIAVDKETGEPYFEHGVERISRNYKVGVVRALPNLQQPGSIRAFC